MTFIQINYNLYSTGTIQRISYNGTFITLMVLDGAKTKQVDVQFDSKEATLKVFEDIIKVLNEKKELYVMKGKPGD